MALWAWLGTGWAAGFSGMVADGAGQPVAGAVVLAHPVGKPAPARPPATVVMDQRGREFIPHVLAVRQGDSVKFPNSDRIQHHVYSFSSGNRFEIKLYTGLPDRPILFKHAGVAVLGCNIHDWMLGYVYVADTPYFAASDAEGHWSLALPAGDYRLTLWHPDLERGSAPPSATLTAAEGAPTAWNPVIPLKRSRRSGKPPAHLQQETYPGEP